MELMRKTVTLYTRQPGQPAIWLQQTLSGVFCREAAGTAVSEAGVQGGQAQTIFLIPAGLCKMPRPGDGIFCGDGPEGDFSGDIRKHVPGCRIISAVTARCYGSILDHWEVIAT